MNRRALQVALVAAGAVLAFGVGAATLDDAIGPREPVRTDGETIDGSNATQEPAAAAAPTGGSCNPCPSFDLGLSPAGFVPSLPRSAVLAIAGLGTVVLALLWRHAGGGRDASIDSAAADEGGVDVTAGSGASGTFAIDDPPATNPVYRAWRDTVGRGGGADSETTTPGEDAAAAIERGWDVGSVETLTDLFARVRYGREDVTEERAERARAAADRLDEEGS